MVHLLFIQDDALPATPGAVRKLLDPACGTGGMLRERRTALIAAAVTGQIDVCHQGCVESPRGAP